MAWSDSLSDMTLLAALFHLLALGVPVLVTIQDIVADVHAIAQACVLCRDGVIERADVNISVEKLYRASDAEYKACCRFLRVGENARTAGCVIMCHV